jgi:hypothetical protein
LNPDGALCYRDRQVEIVAEESPSKRLLVTKRGTSRLGAETSNPIVCTNREGEPIRWHGEYVKIAAHVRVLALSTLKEQPAETSSEGSRER